ncbi:hypothetical protein [Aliikangiella maris]|uniref:Uncharacterized protein n=2 Tax=Aliikangiella maris TaxID=3162458 RepID=A0ABV3MTM8_9GAMM
MRAIQSISHRYLKYIWGLIALFAFNAYAEIPLISKRQRLIQSGFLGKQQVVVKVLSSTDYQPTRYNKAPPEIIKV